jgi:hypothetical protein
MSASNLLRRAAAAWLALILSLLAEAHRKGRLNEIKEEHFPKPGPMPKVPEATDDVQMEVPPGDLPTGERLPKAG